MGGGNTFQKIDEIEIASINADKSFVYNQGTPLNMNGKNELFIYVQWYIENRWNSYGNGTYIPLDVLREGTVTKINFAGGFKTDASNVTEYFFTQELGYRPYVWAQFISSSYTPTKARILVYAR